MYGGMAPQQEYSLYVGDLGPDVTDAMLLATFQAQFPRAHAAKVITDASTGMSKGYAFVRFSAKADAAEALAMHGQFCGSSRMRVVESTTARHGGGGGGGGGGGSRALLSGDPASDPNNTMLFIGGIDSNLVTAADLHMLFAPLGNITYCKVAPGKNCGFVQYDNRASAEMALASLNGQTVAGTCRMRLSWGRSQPGAGARAAAMQPGVAQASAYAQAASYAFQQQYGSTAGVPAAYGASSNALMPAPVASAYGAPAYGTAMHAAYGQAAVAPPAAPAAAETAAAAPLEPSVATPFDPDAKFDIAAANAVFMRSKQLHTFSHLERPSEDTPMST